MLKGDFHAFQPQDLRQPSPNWFMSLLQTIQETRKNFNIFQQFNMYKSQKMVINNSKYYLRKIALETDQMTGVKGQGH